jgi:TnpA family transposase
MVAGQNPYLSVNDDGVAHVTTPALDDRETEYISTLLSQQGYIPVLRVLSEIDHVSNFSSYFKHHNLKNRKIRPKASTFHAGAIALGCNIGVPQMAQISPGINENTLTNTVNWYFDLKSIQNANQCVVDLINRLSLSNIFVSNKNKEHSASDGSKFNVAVESLLATYSFKYFGKDKGISIYTFIDERQSLFHSLVLSASEREAAYVIDGLNKISSPQVAIHSTDMHGYTESIFGVTHLLDIAFAPRLKQVGKQRRYALSNKQSYLSKGYKILPNQTINQSIIKDNWDDFLRLMVTIKLKKTTASQIFKRLSSYAKTNPLYKAMKEFGRIIKSLFILTYFDDMPLRQRIEKQLSRIENANRFSRAVFYANNGELMQGAPEEQEIAITAKALIQNCIILWNYLSLSQILSNCIDAKERKGMVNIIREGSVISWRHVNLHGEFDFKRHAANASTFNMDKILSLRVS